MKIVRDDASATLTLIPTAEHEKMLVSELVSVLKSEDKLSYGGRLPDTDDDRFVKVILHFGGQVVPQISKVGMTTIERQQHIGSIKLVLCGDTLDDKLEVNGIRNRCFTGSGGAIYLRTEIVDHELSLVITLRRCKLCNGCMITHTACEWGICDACAKQCAHRYERGVVYRESDVGIGEFCEICGRGKPPTGGEHVPSIQAQQDAVERELGIHIAREGESLPSILEGVMGGEDIQSGQLPQA